MDIAEIKCGSTAFGIESRFDGRCKEIVKAQNWDLLPDQNT